MKLSLRHKLLAAVVLYLLLLVCVGSLGLYAAQTSVERLHVAVEHHFREVSLIGELSTLVGRMRANSLLHTLSGSTAEWDRYEADMSRLEAEADALVQELLENEAAFADQHDIDQIQAFSGAWSEFVDVRNHEFLPLSRENRDEEALALAQPGGRLDQAYRRASAQLRALRAALETESGEQLAQAERDLSRNRNVLVAAVLIAGAFGIGFGLLHSTRLARAVQAVSGAAARVAAGDFSQRVEIRTADEIESLGQSFNVMTASLQQMTEAQSEHLQQVEVANRALEAEVLERLWAEAALRESEARFRSVTQSVNEGIISVDSHGTIVFWNRGAQAIFGYTEEEIVGQPLFRLIPERYRPTLQAKLERARLAETVEPFGNPQDWYGLRKDQTEFPLDMSLANWTKGGKVFFSGVVRDATERRAVERMKNEFIAMVSHELRTPMNSVIGMTDLLLRTELGLEQREYAEAVQRSGNVLLGLINDILDLSKIEAGKLDLEVTDLDIREVVEEVATELAEQTHGKDLEIVCAIQPDLPPVVRGDPSRLRQVLLNLVSNAVKFTTSGEVVLRVRPTHNTRDAVTVRFEVADTGIGIQRDAQPLLFRPFQQLDGSGRRAGGGTGLGLAIAKRLVELMGGELGAESAAGKGSTFWFGVPFERPTGASPAAPAVEPAPDFHGARVLLLDGSNTSRAALAQQLKAWGLVTEAIAPTDARLVLQRLRAAASEGAPYRWAILGTRLGGADSLDLAWVIKTDPDPAVAAIRLILVTPAGSRSAAGQDVRAADVEWLQKPVRRARLLEALKRATSGACNETDQPNRSVSMRLLLPEPSGPRVLLAEDSPMSRQVALSMLRNLGYRADVAEDGQAALEALGRAAYAAVLMDCQLPDLDGYDVAAELRRREGSARGTPIIAITASAMKGDRERCLAAGMSDYLAKPIRFDDLARVLARWAPHPQAAARPGHQAWTNPIERSALVMLRGLLVAARQAADRHDPETLWRAAHSFRAESGAVGAREVEAVCAALERLGRGGTTLGAHELCTALEGALERAITMQDEKSGEP